MTDQPTSWQAPEPQRGPTPGIAFAGPGARLVAYIVDIIITFFAIIAFSILGALVTFLVPPLGVLVIVFAVLVIPLIYFPYYWATSGQTPGMKMMGIRVVRDRDGGPVTAGQAVLRLLGYWVSGLVFYLGYLWILVDRRRRGWHDLMAGTVVVEAARQDRAIVAKDAA